jgi:hypothetical protein
MSDDGRTHVGPESSNAGRAATPGLPEFIHRHAALIAEWMTGLAPRTTLI